MQYPGLTVIGYCIGGLGAVEGVDGLRLGSMCRFGRFWPIQPVLLLLHRCISGVLRVLTRLFRGFRFRFMWCGDQMGALQGLNYKASSGFRGCRGA